MSSGPPSTAAATGAGAGIGAGAGGGAGAAAGAGTGAGGGAGAATGAGAGAETASGGRGAGVGEGAGGAAGKTGGGAAGWGAATGAGDGARTAGRTGTGGGATACGGAEMAVPSGTSASGLEICRRNSLRSSRNFLSAPRRTSSWLKGVLAFWGRPAFNPALRRTFCRSFMSVLRSRENRFGSFLSGLGWRAHFSIILLSSAHGAAGLGRLSPGWRA
jgi:hypothetical protein